MFEVIGWLSSFFFGICGFPQAYHSWKTGRADDITASFLYMWMAGEVLGVIYVLSFPKIPIPILVNYFVSIVVVLIIMKYKFYPRKKKRKEIIPKHTYY